jgi:hypothetical protein
LHGSEALARRTGLMDSPHGFASWIRLMDSMERTMISGSCLCGAVTLRIEEPLEHAPEACHCSQCRKHTGNFWTGVNVRRTVLDVQGADSVAWYRSSGKVRRGSCAVCGSTLFWDPMIEGYPWIAVALGCIDTPLQLKIAKHTFVSSKGGYYEILDGAPQCDRF